ncbi:class I SAM-dependent methyltransferase [Sphaerobacter thermophilus]|uniref:Methyltransferase type 11 n=1 Tax=Sphaerobacter thermophilus (strain ATCC 49802 / DSM 20745 / KCCM 41009 / NCIMB 13125 / S 6022) TaxID=479434 RepID=D1C6B8_SPHTD|nr:class I SAM-dependent methyltransferase [Sphaerobacter thermophilus]ACZ37656.1 Methyltransferase type 11 [Sphaerobacter thermophilus DSM 20745]
MRRFLTIIGAIGAVAAAVVWWRRQREAPAPFSARLSWVLSLPQFEHARADVILDRLDLRPGMRVLDAGAGTGRLTIPAARRVAPNGEVVALDIQPEMLAKLEQRAAAEGVTNIRTVQAALGDGALEPESFDRALLVAVLGETPDQLAVLRDLHAALKPGGILSVSEGFPDPHYQRADHVRALAAVAGFRPWQEWRTRLGYTLHLVKEG